MKNATAKFFALWMTAAGALFVAATLYFLTSPTLREVNALAAKLTEAETEIQAQYANRRQLSNTIEHVKAAKLGLADLASQFVRPGDELTFITAIEGIGERDGVETKLRLDVGGGGIADAKEFDRGFSLTIDGPYPSVLRALVDLERLAQITVIQNISIRGGSAGPNQAVPVAVSLNGLFASPPKGL